ncbi:MAG: PAS domain-containing protein, partial [Bacteroidota bacterium]
PRKQLRDGGKGRLPVNAAQKSFSPRQIARGLGMSESAIKRWIDAGQMVAQRTAGGHRRVLLAEILRFVREGDLDVLRPEVFGLHGLSGVLALTSDEVLPEGRALEILGALGLALDVVAEGITVADMRREGQPLVFANQAFYAITGYQPEETLGRNCRFLQGPETDPNAVQIIHRALDAGEAVSIELLNYRKNGEPFWNRLSLVPVGGTEGRPDHYVGVQRDVTPLREAERRLAKLGRTDAGNDG